MTVEYELLDRKYLVSDSGKIYYLKKDKWVLKKTHNCHGYENAGFYSLNTKKYTTINVHTIVWNAFKGPIPDGYQVNHINEDKFDNRLENLNLMTPKENCNYGTRNTKISKARQQHVNFHRLKRPVIKYDINNNILAEYVSINEAGKENNLDGGSILYCCNNIKRQDKLLQQKGFAYKFKK